MKLHFETAGQGEPLVILHGLFGSLDNWRSVTAKLVANFRVFLLDQRNHGRSAHTFEMDYSLMAADVVELLQSHGVAAANVLGHSMGGKTAMRLALDYPDAVRKLLVADISPRSYSPRHQRIIDGMLSLELSRFATRKELEAALAPAVADLPTRQFLLKNLMRQSDGRFHWRLGLEELKHNYRRLTEAVHSPAPFLKPALFLRGENSEYLLPADFPEIQRLFPRAVLETIPGAGHLLHVQQTDLFVDRIRQFVLGK